MSDLLRKPFGAHGKVHEITPASAGWRYVGFSLYRLRPGEGAAEATGGREVILVIVEGKAAVTAARTLTWPTSSSKEKTMTRFLVGSNLNFLTCGVAHSAASRPRVEPSQVRSSTLAFFVTTRVVVPLL